MPERCPRCRGLFPEASSQRGTARTRSTSPCAASRSAAAPATPRGGRRRRFAATSTGEAAGRRCRSMSRSWTRRMRAHPARPPKARSTRRWLACGPCWKTRLQTRGASLARRVGQSCGSGTGRASAKVVDDLLASLGAATVPAPGYAQLPFSRASDVRRALEGYAAQHHLGFEARDIRFENGSLLPRRSSLAAADPRALHCRRSPSADHAHDVRSLRRGPDRVSVPCGLRCRPVHSPPALPLFCREWFRAAELAGVARYGFEELHNEDGDRVYRRPLSGEWARHACGAFTPCACRAGTPRGTLGAQGACPSRTRRRSLRCTSSGTRLPRRRSPSTRW